jgi:hypothetical protein
VEPVGTALILLMAVSENAPLRTARAGRRSPPRNAGPCNLPFHMIATTRHRTRNHQPAFLLPNRAAVLESPGGPARSRSPPLWKRRTGWGRASLQSRRPYANTYRNKNLPSPRAHPPSPGHRGTRDLTGNCTDGPAFLTNRVEPPRPRCRLRKMPRRGRCFDRTPAFHRPAARYVMPRGIGDLAAWCLQPIRWPCSSWHAGMARRGGLDLAGKMARRVLLYRLTWVYRTDTSQ